MYKTKRFVLFLITSFFLSVFYTSSALAKNEVFRYAQAFFPFFAGAFCIFPIIMFIVWIIIGIWVYKDAQQRGENGVLWLLIVLVSGVIGLIIWLLIRPQPGEKRGSVLDGLGINSSSNQRSGRICPKCARPIPMDAKVCPYCGNRF